MNSTKTAQQRTAMLVLGTILMLAGILGFAKVLGLSESASGWFCAGGAMTLGAGWYVPQAMNGEGRERNRR